MLRNTTVRWAWPAKLLHWIGAARHPASSRPWLVDDAHGNASGPPGPLQWACGAGLRPAAARDPAAAVALGQPGARAAFRSAAVGAHCGAGKPHRPLPAHARRLVHRLGACRDLQDADDQGSVGLPVPQIVASQDRSIHSLFEQSHTILSYLLAALVVIHVAASLRHHFIKHNNVLKRMWFIAEKTWCFDGWRIHRERRRMRKLIVAALAAALTPAAFEAAAQSATPAAPYSPGIAEIMIMTQIRHAKLWLAGDARNWDLADYQIDELKEGLEDVVKYFPVYKEIPVGRDHRIYCHASHCRRGKCHQSTRPDQVRVRI